MVSLVPGVVVAASEQASARRPHLWLAARYRCADEAARAADRIRREVSGDVPGNGVLEPRLSGSTLSVDFEPPQRDVLIRLVRRTHGRVIAI